MTNDMKAGKLAITKCEKCRDGYLIVKSGKGNGYFLGCTNFTMDRKGCNNTISSVDYYTQMNYSSEPVPVVQKMRARDIAPKNAETQKIVPTMQEKKVVERVVDVQKALAGKVYYKEFDLYDVVGSLLNCLEHISEKRFYGITILVATVRGGNRKAMRDGNLMEVPEYGRYWDISRGDMWSVVLWLIDNHYMLRTKEHYPKLHPTYEGRHYEETLTIEKLMDLKDYLEDPNREIAGVEEDGDEK